MNTFPFSEKGLARLAARIGLRDELSSSDAEKMLDNFIGNLKADSLSDDFLKEDLADAALINPFITKIRNSVPSLYVPEWNKEPYDAYKRAILKRLEDHTAGLKRVIDRTKKRIKQGGTDELLCKVIDLDEMLATLVTQTKTTDPKAMALALITAADRDAHQQATYHHKERKLREAQDVLRAQKEKLLVSAPLQQILTVRKGLIKKSYAVDMKNVCAITVTDFGIGLRPDLLLEEKAYHMKVEQKPATSLWQRCMDDFIAYCSGFMNPDKPHEQRKIELAQRIMADDSRVRIGDYLDVLYKAPRATIKQLITALDAPMGDFPAKVRQQVQDAVLTDLETTLQSRPKDKRNATLERVVRRFKPTHYDEKFTPHKTYVVHRCREPSILKAAAKATGSSCIRDQDLNAFADMIADVGTLFFVGLEERKVMGYMRLFVFKDKEKNIVLGVDTFEPPAKDFETHIDIVNAFGLAAVTFCLDIGAKYVVANDGRIKYGPRAAFSNTEKSVHLTKLGRTPPRNQYTFVVDEHGAYQGTPYVLIENWRV